MAVSLSNVPCEFFDERKTKAVKSCVSCLEILFCCHSQVLTLQVSFRWKMVSPISISTSHIYVPDLAISFIASAT